MHRKYITEEKKAAFPYKQECVEQDDETRRSGDVGTLHRCLASLSGSRDVEARWVGVGKARQGESGQSGQGKMVSRSERKARLQKLQR